jgi:Phosphotransferase enzyme family
MSRAQSASPVEAEPLRIFASLAEMQAELTSRRPFKTADSLSGSRFESAQYRGADVIVKYVCVDDDWIMRATGDLHCRQLTLFSSHVLDRLPRSIDHATLAVAPYVSSIGHRGGAFVLRELSASLVPPGSDTIELATHLRFLDHMAELHAAYWDSPGGDDLFPLPHHYVFLTPTMAGLERERGSRDPVPAAVATGWSRMREIWPASYAALRELADEPGPLAAALAGSPRTLVHGDWKLGNLGAHGDGRTILLDWDRCGVAPGTFDLAWYLAVNCDRLPHSKEAAIDAYRLSLSSHGVVVGQWWDRQLALTLLGAFLQLGWAKTEDAEEFRWWNGRLTEGLRLL